MTRDSLLAQLAVYGPADARERAMVAQCVAFIRGHSDCFERTNLWGHVTASAWVLDETGRYALLTHHRKLGRWLQLGGHADGDENVRRVARREAIEESGLARIRLALPTIYDVDVHDIPAHGAEPAHQHFDIRFAFFADRAAPLVVSSESHELAWRELAVLDTAQCDESVRRLARKSSMAAIQRQIAGNADVVS